MLQVAVQRGCSHAIPRTDLVSGLTCVHAAIQLCTVQGRRDFRAVAESIAFVLCQGIASRIPIVFAIGIGIDNTLQTLGVVHARPVALAAT